MNLVNALAAFLALAALAILIPHRWPKR